MAIFKNEAINAVAVTIIAVLLGLLVLGLYSSVNMFLGQHPDPVLSSQWTVGCLSPVAGLVFCVLIMLALSKGRLSGYGFRIAGNLQIKRVAILGLVIGVLMTLLEPLLAIEEHAAVADLSFVQIVVIVWLGASIFEEVLTRGLIQGILTPLTKHGFTLFGLRISLPVLVSALFFGLMHLGLLSLGMGLYSVLYVVIFAFILGLMAGYYREKTGSLIPAVILHMFGNVGGTCAGYVVELFR